MKRLLMLLFVCSYLATADDTAVHWSELDHAIRGKIIIVNLINGKHVKGNPLSVAGDALVVETRNGRQSIARRSVHSVRVLRHAGVRWRLTGTAIGAGTGAAIAIPVLAETHNEGSGSYDLAAVALIGGLAAIGYFVGWSADRAGDLLQLLPD